MTTEQWQDKAKGLILEAFTDEFLNNQLCIDVLFDLLDCDRNLLDTLDFYVDGEILHYIVDITEENSKIIDQIIKDKDAYFKYVDLLFLPNYDPETEVNLIGVINALQSLFGDVIHYDKDGDEFYYNVGDIDI